MQTQNAQEASVRAVSSGPKIRSDVKSRTVQRVSTSTKYRGCLSESNNHQEMSEVKEATTKDRAEGWAKSATSTSMKNLLTPFYDQHFIYTVLVSFFLP